MIAAPMPRFLREHSTAFRSSISCLDVEWDCRHALSNPHTLDNRFSILCSQEQVHAMSLSNLHSASHANILRLFRFACGVSASLNSSNQQVAGPVAGRARSCVGEVAARQASTPVEE
eukprot:830647-Amphidinium_carterae.1